MTTKQEKRMALVLREPAVKVGKGDKTYKTLTAAVKAAEKAKEEAREAAADAWHAACDAAAAAQGVQSRFCQVERQMFWWSVGVVGVLVIQVALVVFG